MIRALAILRFACKCIVKLLMGLVLHNTASLKLSGGPSKVPTFEEHPTDLRVEQPTTMPGHIRFNEDNSLATVDPVTESALPTILEEKTHPDPDSDEEDDAPEAITQISARDQAKAARQEATKIIESRRIVDKQKRRSQADRLKEQAKNSKRGSKRKRTAAKDAHVDGADEALKSPRKKALPDLLPDDILAAEPPPRFPTPESEDGDVVSQPPPRTAENLEKALAKATKGPKDVKRGSFNVRVLEKKNALLPPRANAQSRNLLESMRSRHGALETKPVKKGFATRSGSK